MFSFIRLWQERRRAKKIQDWFTAELAMRGLQVVWERADCEDCDGDCEVCDQGIDCD